MAKRQLIHTSKAIIQKVTSSGVYNQLRGKHHWHFCSNRECRLAYEDCCAQTEVNGLCQLCRGAGSRAYAEPMDPRECCLDNCEQVLTTDEMLRFHLAGPGPWFKCKTCARTHGWPCATTI